MTDSVNRPRVQIKEDEDEKQSTQNLRLCDFCGESIAVLYCRADSAKLCFSCDREVHSTNQLFAKHSRSQLCDSCDSTPASIFCSTDNLVLCQNCDWETHTLSLTSIHERRPLEGFAGCPSVTELLAAVGCQDLTKKDLLFGDDESVGSGFGFSGSDGGVDEFSEFLVWDTPSIVTLDDLIVSNNSEHSFPAMGVPPLPKNRKAVCGKYKEEILGQLREMAKKEPGFSDFQGEIEPFIHFQSLVPEQDRQRGDTYAEIEHGSELATISPKEADAFQWFNDNIEFTNQGPPVKLVGSYVEENCFVPDKDSDICGSASHANCCHELQSHNCVVTETIQVLPKVAVRELTIQERETAISRYKEKKKTRRYEKHVRYESRKVRAQSRTRIKGRFAKLDQ